jgi:hypothetical protein
VTLSMGLPGNSEDCNPSDDKWCHTISFVRWLMFWVAYFWTSPLLRKQKNIGFTR